MFLKNKTKTMRIDLEDPKRAFADLWTRIDAEGDLSAALAEFDVRYNARSAASAHATLTGGRRDAGVGRSPIWTPVPHVPERSTRSARGGQAPSVTSPSSSSSAVNLSRRRVLQGGIVAAGAALLAGLGIQRARRAGNRTITGDFPNGFTVPAGEAWEIKGTATSAKNVIVNGILVMRPGALLQFRNTNEASYVGGGMDPIDTDVGLWVMGAGKLDAIGTTKTPWARTNTDPTWLSTDELRSTPVSPTAGKVSTAFTKGGTLGTWNGHTSEILNLTRDVRIEGTAGHRSHIFIRSTSPQTVKNVQIRYMGPRRDNTASGFVLGRYGLHFHMMGDASRGSLVENVVVRDSGSWGFVPHESNGITFRGCIAQNMNSDGFTWDASTLTYDVVFENCVASDIVPPSTTYFTMAGFMLGRGTGNICRDCVATCVRGGFSSTGFEWPETANQTPNVWTFNNNVAHNNGPNGIWVWQNDPNPHVVKNVVLFSNDQDIEHGAYENGYDYSDIRMEAATNESLKLHALSRITQPRNLLFENVVVHGRDRTPNAIRMTKHRLASETPVTFRNWRIDGLTAHAVVIAQQDDGGFNPGNYDFVACTVEGHDFAPMDIQRLSVVGGTLRSQRRDGTAWSMDLATGATKSIAAFA
jgi:hypothetical protein